MGAREWQIGMNAYTLTILIALLTALVGCRSKDAALQKEPGGVPRIVAGHCLHITLSNQLTGAVVSFERQVQRDGTIALPYVGDLDVGGKRLAEIRKLVTLRYQGAEGPISVKVSRCE